MFLWRSSDDDDDDNDDVDDDCTVVQTSTVRYLNMTAQASVATNAI